MNNENNFILLKLLSIKLTFFFTFLYTKFENFDDYPDFYSK